jgi:hypothetical protein
MTIVNKFPYANISIVIMGYFLFKKSNIHEVAELIVMVNDAFNVTTETTAAQLIQKSAIICIYFKFHRRRHILSTDEVTITDQTILLDVLT